MNCQHHAVTDAVQSAAIRIYVKMEGPVEDVGLRLIRVVSAFLVKGLFFTHVQTSDRRCPESGRTLLLCPGLET